MQENPVAVSAGCALAAPAEAWLGAVTFLNHSLPHTCGNSRRSTCSATSTSLGSAAASAASSLSSPLAHGVSAGCCCCCRCAVCLSA